MKQKSLKKIFLPTIFFISLILHTNLESRVLPKKFTKFENYKKRAKTIYSIPKQFVFIKKFNLEFRYYDLTGNKKGDVLEIYRHSKYKYPIIYGFDMNGDGKFKRNELLKDKLGDDLNGNEKPVSKWEYKLRKYLRD